MRTNTLKLHKGAKMVEVLIEINSEILPNSIVELRVVYIEDNGVIAKIVESEITAMYFAE